MSPPAVERSVARCLFTQAGRIRPTKNGFPMKYENAGANGGGHHKERAPFMHGMVRFHNYSWKREFRREMLMPQMAIFWGCTIMGFGLLFFYTYKILSTTLIDSWANIAPYFLKRFFIKDPGYHMYDFEDEDSIRSDYQYDLSRKKYTPLNQLLHEKLAYELGYAQDHTRDH